jgi:branched-chain amino acid transport system permease protein
MEFFLEQFITALSIGGIYAGFALALVMVYKSTGHVNFAQGEMAMVSTFVAWSLMQYGLPLWLAFFLTVLFSIIMGMLLERFVIRPFALQPASVIVTVFVGVFITLNSLAGWIWGFTARPFTSPFPNAPLAVTADLAVRWHTLGSIIVSGVVLLLMFCFFRFTPLGLAMRGAADNPASSRLLGINVNRMLAFGWALAAVIGAIAGIMMAPYTFLDPHMMAGPLIFYFAAALLGGITSPLGAVVGGYAIGLMEVLVSNTIPHGNEFRTTFALAIIIAVLLFRPQGLLGTVIVKRV